MMTLTKCFSVLVASGNGHKCSNLKDIVREELNSNYDSSRSRQYIFKDGAKEFPDDFLIVANCLAKKVYPLFKTINDHYYVDDKKKRNDKPKTSNLSS